MLLVILLDPQCLCIKIVCCTGHTILLNTLSVSGHFLRRVTKLQTRTPHSLCSDAVSQTHTYTNVKRFKTYHKIPGHVQIKHPIMIAVSTPPAAANIIQVTI